MSIKIDKLKQEQEIDILDIFLMGVDYGQLTMEQERQSEETFDSFLGHFYSEKLMMPMAPVERRRVHSEKWFKAKEKGLLNFQNLFISLKGKTKFKMICSNYKNDKGEKL